MKKALLLGVCAAVAALLATGSAGCARAANDTSGYAIQDSAVVDAPFEETWQAMKAVLRDQGYDIYTRDKRGIFVAYHEVKRSKLGLQPNRIKYTIELAPVSSDETKVFVETVKQIYGTSMFTYPDWHDRPAGDNAAALEMLSQLQAKLSGTEAAPAEAGAEAPAGEEGAAEVEEVEAAPAAI